MFFYFFCISFCNSERYDVFAVILQCCCNVAAKTIAKSSKSHCDGLFFSCDDDAKSIQEKIFIHGVCSYED